MTTRTVKILGLAYGSSPAEITVNLDGNLVYSGTVTTLDTPVPELPNKELDSAQIEFCSFELPMDFSGTKPMSCSVTNGTVIFGEINANYCVIPGSDPVVGSGPDGYACIDGAGDSRSNVEIDGVAQPVNHEEMPGTWWFVVSTGSTLTYNLDVQAGTEAVAP